MKNLKALSVLTGDYGHVQPDEVFKAEDDVAESLIERKLAKLTSKGVTDVEGSPDTDDDDQTAKERAAGQLQEDKLTTDLKQDAGAKKLSTKDDKGAKAEESKEDKTVSTESLK